MKNNNLIRFVQSLVFLPVMAMSIPVGNIHNVEIPHNVLVQQLNITAKGAFALNQAKDPEVASSSQLQKARLDSARQAKADAIDTYFKEHNMPLAGTGMKMVIEAEKNDLDWRLLPAIAARESTGGRNACIKVKNNAFGWGSCKIGFKSDDEAIETVARNLGGNNPNTAFHYDNKTTKEILRAYNPPSIVPKYVEQVISIMNTVGDEDMSAALAMANT
jgi:hypothetical protein